MSHKLDFLYQHSNHFSVKITIRQLIKLFNRMADLPFDDNNDDGSLAVQDAKPQLQKPPMYQVLLLNDDFTPMDFVVSILQSIFYKDKEEAVRITMNVHTNGIGVCGVYTKDIAETKVQQVLAYSQENQHPLQCTLEEVE